ncbi:Mu transposase C-terminal domain-containing protein [Rhizobium leguminosarum]|uniref:Mu transposase C-terminal domain-containing protein n=1 Tax=Rhizobium leguminosarum TaxID=384 RepID=UPI003F991F36
MNVHHSHFKKEQIEPRFRFKEGSGLTISTTDYVWIKTVPEGHLFQRMDGSNAVEAFDHAKIATFFADPRNRAVHFLGKYSVEGAEESLGAAASLSMIPEERADKALWKELLCRTFKQVEYVNPSVNRTEEGLVIGLALALAKMKETQKLAFQSAGKKLTRRNKEIKEHKIPAPLTFYRWLLTYERDIDNPMVLVDNYKDKRKPRMGDEVRAIMNRHVRGFAAPKAKIVTLYRAMETEIVALNVGRAEKDKLSVPSPSTFSNEIHKLPQSFVDFGRLGEKRATELHRLVAEGLDVVRPFERLEMDEHYIDIHVRLAETELYKHLTQAERDLVVNTRLWATAAICVGTRAMAGFRIHRESPSLNTAIATLEMTTRDKSDLAASLGCETPWEMFGTLEKIAVDSATWFSTQLFRGVVGDLGATTFMPRTGIASCRGTIERFFGSLTKEAFEGWDGRTLELDERYSDRDPEKTATMVLEKLIEILTRHVVDGYHNKKHEALGNESPREAWKRLAHQHGVLPPPTGERRRHIFGINARRKLSRKGIRFFGIQYYSAHSQSLFFDSPANANVLIRVDQQDLGHISVWHPTKKGWFQVPAERPEFAGMTVWEWATIIDFHKLYRTSNCEIAAQTLARTREAIRNDGRVSSLEARLGSPTAFEKNYDAWERRMAKVVQISDCSRAEPEVDVKSWTPSNDFLSMLGFDMTDFAYNDPPAKPKQSRKAQDAAAGQTTYRDASHANVMLDPRFDS